MSLYWGLLILFFLMAGYFGAVRSIMLDMPVDWVRALQDDDLKTMHLVYWRRILRMARLTMLSLGCFCIVAATYAFSNMVLGLPTWVFQLVLFVVAAFAWILSYGLWIRIGRTKPALISLRAFPVRFAEWFHTPVYWLLEPFLREYPSKGRSISYSRDETVAADDLDYEDNRIEERMFINALDFKDVRIRDCMIPRTEITAVALDDTIEDLRQAFISSGHSKIVVYRESIDDVVGYCHSLALFRKPKEITSIITPMLIVPEAMPASDLMLRFLEERKSLALVVDEFGGTAGLVSVEDVVEEIFGEIQDEYDSTEDWTERRVDENTFILSARHEIDYLNEKYNWAFPEGDYDTLAGLLIHTHGDLPKVNEVIYLPNYTFKVISMQDTRIELVRLTILAED